MRTFVYHPGALGDTLLSLPCLRAIRKDFSWLHIAGRGDVAELLRDLGIADEASSADNVLYASLHTKVGGSTRAFLEGFGRAFVFTAQNDLSVSWNIETVVPFTRAIRTIPPPGSLLHVTGYRLMQLIPGLRDEGAPLRLSRELREKAADLLRNNGWRDGTALLVIHPGSGGRAKCWPLKRYRELAQKVLRDNRVFVLFFSGPAESPETTRELDCFTRDHAPSLHAASVKLSEAAALLSHCSLFIGNDSGMTHLAAALDRPVIALFGPTDPALWKPAGGQVEIILAGPPGSIDDISLDEVYVKAVSMLTIRGNNGKKNRRNAGKLTTSTRKEAGAPGRRGGKNET